ncbi:hypothetical protein LINPERPRIM_LOCUS23471 [Linum perenne]
MEHYHFSSAPFFSKTLLAIKLLIVTIVVTISGESGCSLAAPVASRACKDDYVDCVTNVLTQLRDRTPYAEHKRFSTYYPTDQPSGGVAGSADCNDGFSFADCQICLSAAMGWLDQTCTTSASATYSEGICDMSYSQI